LLHFCTWTQALGHAGWITPHHVMITGDFLDVMQCQMFSLKTKTVHFNCFDTHHRIMDSVAIAKSNLRNFK